MTTCFTVCVFCERLSILCMCSSFSFGFQDGVWDLIVFIPDHCLSIYFGPIFMVWRDIAADEISKLPYLAIPKNGNNRVIPDAKSKPYHPKEIQKRDTVQISVFI